MAYIEPNTEIRFLTDVPLDPDYENTLYFPTRAAQTDYFLSKGATVFQRNSYQRVSKGVMKVGAVLDELGGSAIQSLFRSSYMMFKNTNFENKWFYAFVDHVEYLNNNTVTVRYHIDVIQTWLIDFKDAFNECMIEREHVTNDSLGANLIPENLETGDYVISEPDTFAYTPGICVVTTEDTAGQYMAGNLVKGLTVNSAYFSGLRFNYFTISEVSQINTLLDGLNQQGKIDGVVAIFMCAYEFRATDSELPPLVLHKTISYRHDGVACLGDGNEANNGYTPRNKKLLSYPYNMLYLTNQQGVSSALHFEYFADPDNAVLSMWGNGSTNPGLLVWPENYCGKARNFEEGVEISGFPPCAWTYDTFKAWLSQNQGIIAAGVGSIALGLISNISGPIRNARNAFSIDPFGVGDENWPTSARLLGATETLKSSLAENKRGLAATAIATFTMLGQVRDHYIKPDTNKGNGNGSLQYQAGNMTALYCKKHIRPEFAKIIDKFFDMYGYATHRCGKPNLNARPCYTYIKTSGCSIGANIPSDDCTLIQQIFDNGVRFWKSNARFGSYDPSVNNNQV